MNGHPTRANSPLASFAAALLTAVFGVAYGFAGCAQDAATTPQSAPAPATPKTAAPVGSVDGRPREICDLRRLPRRRRQQRDAGLAEPCGPAPGVHRAPAQGFQDRRAQERHDDAVRADAFRPGRRRRRSLLRGTEADAEGRGPRAHQSRPADLSRRDPGPRHSGVHRVSRTDGARQPVRGLSANRAGSTPPTSRSRYRTTSPASALPTRTR